MQDLRTQILDESTGAAIPDAQVYAANAQGNPTAIGRSDARGGVSAMVPDTSLNILVVASGYAPLTIDAGDANDQGYVNLTRASLAAGDATSTIKNTTLSAVPWWVWVAGAGGVIYVVSRPDRKKISGDKGAGYIIPVGIVVLAYLVLKGFNLFGPSAASENQAGIDTSTAAGIDASLSAQQSAGENPTLTPAQAAGIADTIFQAGLQKDAYTVKRNIIQANNLSDLLLIMQAFGTKKADISALSPCYLLGIFCQSYNLQAWLHTPFMDSSTLTDINNYLSAQGINYQF